MASDRLGALVAFLLCVKKRVTTENPSIAVRIPILMSPERRATGINVFFLVVVGVLVLALGGLEVIASHRLVDGGHPPSNIPISRPWYWK